MIGKFGWSFKFSNFNLILWKYTYLDGKFVIYLIINSKKEILKIKLFDW